MPEINKQPFFYFFKKIKSVYSASIEEADKREKLAILDKFKAQCSEAIEEIRKNRQRLAQSDHETGAIELENLNPPQKKDDLEVLLSEITQLHESFYEKIRSYIESNDVQHIEGLKEITAKLKEKFASATELALDSGFLKQENLFHRIINAMAKVLIIKECIFNSIINGDILKPSKEYERMLTNRINAKAAEFYAGPVHEKILKILSGMVAAEQESQAQSSEISANQGRLTA